MEATDWLRKEAETYLRKALRDREDGLFFGAPLPGAAAPPLFEARTRGEMRALYPRTEALARFEAEMRRFWRERDYRWEEDELLRLLLARRDRRTDGAELLLWYRGVKLMEDCAGPAEIRRYEKAVRQRAAVCLREDAGGALWAAGMCIAELKRKENGL